MTTLRDNEPDPWMEMNNELDRYKAGIVARDVYLAAFDRWHTYKRESNRRAVARIYGQRYAHPRENEE